MDNAYHAVTKRRKKRKRRKILNKVARFSKVSFNQFLNDYLDTYHEADESGINMGLLLNTVKQVYDSIKLPKRMTRQSAGYDFFSPMDVKLKPGETIKIPTGIRCEIDPDWVLMMYPRSSLGFKYRLQLDNTVGVIDSDYYTAKNEGHIFLKLTNDSKTGKIVELQTGNGIAQGIFVQYGITLNDNAEEERTGGIGSTGK